jgi:cephalosporin hydroxylase
VINNLNFYVTLDSYFSNSRYYAIDYPQQNATMMSTCLAGFKEEHPAADVKNIWFGDQSNTTFLKKVIKEFQQDKKTTPKTWDIIVDDGGHRFNQITSSFKNLWPHISRGGLYVIEDLNMDHGFSKVMGTWMTLISQQTKETISPVKKLESNIPLGVAEMGCSYQICYFRKKM